MITVSVSGLAGSGKSSLVYTIANMLLRMGFAVDVKLLDGLSMHDMSQNVMNNLVDIRDKHVISVVEVQERQVGEKVAPILTLVKNNKINKSRR